MLTPPSSLNHPRCSERRCQSSDHRRIPCSMVPGLLILYHEHSSTQSCVIHSLQMNMHEACAVHMPGSRRRCPFPSRSGQRNPYVRMVQRQGHGGGKLEWVGRAEATLALVLYWLPWATILHFWGNSVSSQSSCPLGLGEDLTLPSRCT